MCGDVCNLLCDHPMHVGKRARTGPAAKFFLYESTDNVAAGCCTFDYNIQRFAS
jgi:hypothetical protein